MPRSDRYYVESFFGSLRATVCDRLAQSDRVVIAQVNDTSLAERICNLLNTFDGFNDEYVRRLAKAMSNASTKLENLNEK